MKKYLVPNSITLLRVILTLIFAFLLNKKLNLEYTNTPSIYIIIICLAVYFTDYIDGKVARRFKAVSVLGSFFDVAADFIFIFWFTVILMRHNLTPEWFLVVIVVKLLDFLVTSRIINNYKKDTEKVFIFDYIGRAAAASFYILPLIIFCINEYLSNNSTFFIISLIYLSTLISLISIIQRISLCLQIKTIRV